jgi:hypothetical protein
MTIGTIGKIVCLCWLSVILATVLTCQASAEAAAGHAAADFEAGLVQEAVDLSAVNTESDGLPGDQKEMESLLHWAIGR